MDRRDTILALAALAVAPLAALAQRQDRVWRLGVLNTGDRALLESREIAAFRQALRELGYDEGRNLVIEWRFADGDVSRLPGLAGELARLRPDVILAGGTPSSRAAQNATKTIPIVFASVGDPLGVGLVKSLAHPGGNVTGLSNLNVDVGPKRLELLLSIAPRPARIGVLVHPDNPNHAILLKNVQAAAEKRRVAVVRVPARTVQDIDDAFPSMRRQKADALLVALDGFFQQQRRQIADLAARHRMPSMTAERMYAEAGCLLSYGSSFAEAYRRVATYVDKILKGAKPGDLPVEQPTKLELVVNARTAAAIGVVVPKALLELADEVIR